MKPIVILFLILVTFAFADQIIVQPPSDDSCVVLQSPNSNYGGNTTLDNEHSAYYLYGQMYYTDSQSMVKFTLPELPPGTGVASAYVKCWISYTYENPASTSHLTCVHLTSDWSEYTVNWSNQPGRSGNYGSHALSGISSPVQYDITSLVRNWYNGTQPNYGLGFQLDGGGERSRLMGYSFCCNLTSKEGSSTNCPMLIINTGDISVEPTSLGHIKSYWH